MQYRANVNEKEVIMNCDIVLTMTTFSIENDIKEELFLPED